MQGSRHGRMRFPESREFCAILQGIWEAPSGLGRGLTVWHLGPTPNSHKTGVRSWYVRQGRRLKIAGRVERSATRRSPSTQWVRRRSPMLPLPPIGYSRPKVGRGATIFVVPAEAGTQGDR
jgi:hypothetical protein